MNLKSLELGSYRILQGICLVGGLACFGGGVSIEFFVGSFLGYGIFGIAANLVKTN